MPRSQQSSHTSIPLIWCVAGLSHSSHSVARCLIFSSTSPALPLSAIPLMLPAASGIRKPLYRPFGVKMTQNSTRASTESRCLNRLVPGAEFVFYRRQMRIARRATRAVPHLRCGRLTIFNDPTLDGADNGLACPDRSQGSVRTKSHRRYSPGWRHRCSCTQRCGGPEQCRPS